MHSLAEQLDTEPALVAPVVGKGELNQLAALVIADGLEIVNRAAPLQAQNRGVLRVGARASQIRVTWVTRVSSRLDST